MDRYYYLVAQLPTLYLGKKSRITRKYFLEQAKKWLLTRDYRKLIQADINATSRDKSGVRSYRKYKQFEYGFRKALAEYRGSVKEGTQLKKTSFPEELVKEGNPLTIETKLLQYRWNYIDKLAREHDFDLDAVVLYYLQLQIMGKLSVFDKEKGQERFNRLVDEKSHKRDNADIE